MLETRHLSVKNLLLNVLTGVLYRQAKTVPNHLQKMERNHQLEEMVEMEQITGAMVTTATMEEMEVMEKMEVMEVMVVMEERMAEQLMYLRYSVDSKHYFLRIVAGRYLKKISE
jgi:hypothetical protein